MKRKASRAKPSLRNIPDRKTSDSKAGPKETKQMSPEPTASKSSISKPAAASAADGGRQAATIRYLDRADMVETFANFDHRPDFRRSDVAHRIRRDPLRRCEGQHADHRPALSRLSPGIAAGRGGGSHQSHAADRDRADAGRRSQAGAAGRCRGSESGLSPSLKLVPLMARANGTSRGTARCDRRRIPTRGRLPGFV